MFETFLSDQPGFALLIWALLYSGDYALTIYGAKLYQSKLKAHVVFTGSYELTPFFQKDINALRLVSPRFLILLLVSLALLAVIWLLSVPYLGMDWLFTLATGVLFLREIAIYMRHMRNIATAHASGIPGAMQGVVQYARWFSLQISSVEVFTFAILFLLIALGWRSWFFGGGFLGCASIGWQHWRAARKARRSQESNSST
jgi:hypothetical protein